MPPILIGREALTEEFSEALANGAGAPGRIMLVTGQRGYGKTVLLTEFRKIAIARGWRVVSETASAGLIERLIDALTPEGMRLNAATIAPNVNIAGVFSASLGSAQYQNARPQSAASDAAGLVPARLRKALVDVLESKDIPAGKGLVITIDETQAIERDDLVALATGLQHVTTQMDERDIPDARRKGVAIVFAGLPTMVNDIVGDEIIGFIRRARCCELGNIPLPDVHNALQRSFSDSGKELSDSAAEAAAAATGGYPYMIQLVGYYAWQAAERGRAKAVTSADLERGIRDAVEVFYDAVCVPTLSTLTDAELEFVQAMAADNPQPVSLADIEARTGHSRSWVNKYRASLIANQVVEAAGRGLVRFAVPRLGDYLAGREEG